MKVYISKCTTSDPDIEGDSQRAVILGAFSTRKLAEDSFTRKEERLDKKCGKWTAQHICFEGCHEIEEYEVDKWFHLGK